MKLKENKIVIFYYAMIIAFTGLVGYISLGKGFDFDILDSVSGDGFWGIATAKGIQENGLFGVWFNNRIGQPDGSVLIDFPSIGNIDVIIMWIISWFADSATSIIYVFLILSFPLDGIAMLLLMRKLDFNWETSFVFSCLFSFAPYHFYRYLGHVSLILYVSIPIALYLGGYIIGVINENKKWKLVVLSVLLGMGYGYYYAFGLIILAVAYLMKFMKLEKKREILKELWISVTVLIAIFVGLLPKLIYSLNNGNNLEAGKRLFFEQEIYGLKIINLLLPVTYSRIKPLRSLTESYISSGAPLINENCMASLGLIGSAGFIVLCFAFIASFANKVKCNSKEWKLIDYLSIITLTFVLVGSVGGFGEIFNWAVTSQIRCYNRSSIVLTCTSLLMVAILINMIRDKNRWISIVVCILMLFTGMYDQVNIGSDNWQDGIRGTQEMYEAYFDRVENALNENAMVYQLPYMEFPEAGFINNVSDYKLFAGYLFTDTLRWSYGSVKGRNERSRELNIDEGMSYQFLAKIKEAGFEAVYIDLDGYVDGGERVLIFYNSLGVTPIVSEDGKLYTYDISEVTILDEWLEPGYSFVNMWAERCGVHVTTDAKVKIANGLRDSDAEAYELLYSWFVSGENTEMSNEEYIDYLYNLLLNREESDAERANWVAEIQKGVLKEEVFYAFLNSEEFRMGKGLVDR